MSYDSDIERVIKEARDQGWRYNLTTQGHHQFLAPDGAGIVHTSGTPGDQRSWNNFMADMKRHGYKHHANGATLGELTGMSGGIEHVPPQPGPEGIKVSARALIRDHFSKHPVATFKVDELVKIVHAVRPDLIPGTITMALSAMAEKGELVRVKMGWYRLATDEDRRAKALGVLGRSEPEVPRPEAPRGPALTVDSAPVGDPDLDADNAEIDAAITKVLDGLSDVQRLLNKHRETMRAIAHLKRLMGGMKL